MSLGSIYSLIFVGSVVKSVIGNDRFCNIELVMNVH